MKLSINKIRKIYNQNFMSLIYKAHTVHKKHWKENELQISTLCSIKTGGCYEDCAYCPQSSRYNTSVEESKMAFDEIIESAKQAKAAGASRFCMGAAWRGPTNRQIDEISKVISEIKSLGMETCVTLGLLKTEQAKKLKEAGLDYYNHNIDTSPEYYEKIITTRKFEDRLETISNVRSAGINVCCGGIIGMGESVDDRLKMLQVLANMEQPPESVPINKLIPIPGTPLGNANKIDTFDFIRTVATARIVLPKSYIRFAAGRENASEEFQALCFFVGVNSIFYGEKLLTANNRELQKDEEIMQKLNLAKA